jgi:hypothetical protein
MMDPDPYQLNTDPKPWVFSRSVFTTSLANIISNSVSFAATKIALCTPMLGMNPGLSQHFHALINHLAFREIVVTLNTKSSRNSLSTNNVRPQTE